MSSFTISDRAWYSRPLREIVGTYNTGPRALLPKKPRETRAPCEGTQADRQEMNEGEVTQMESTTDNDKGERFCLQHQPYQIDQRQDRGL